MHYKKLSTSLALGLGLSAAIFSGGASASAITGKTDLVCASVNVVACTDGNCIQGQAQTFDLPTFMFVDVKRKLVHAVDESGKEVSSTIRDFEVTDKAIILQGFENHRGWTVGLDRANGKMTLSTTGADINFTVFGNCTER